jgi:hypothetical protein
MDVSRAKVNDIDLKFGLIRRLLETNCSCNSAIILTSIRILKGKVFAQSAAQACIPFVPNTDAKKSG